MAHNQEMLEKHAEKGDWQKVRIIGMSIDQDKQKLINHVNEKKWTSVEHYWARNGKCDGDKVFGVRGVPHCLLVDTHGKIVWIGHPASRNLEEDIDNLLAGKQLELKPDSEDEDSDNGNEGEGEEVKAIDTASATAAIKAFEQDTKELLSKEEFKVNASKLMRGFLVLASETTCDLKNAGLLKTKMTCHTVLMGPTDACETTQAACMAISHAEGHIWKN